MSFMSAQRAMFRTGIGSSKTTAIETTTEAEPSLMRFLTHGGAVVEVRYSEGHSPYKWRCLGCLTDGSEMTVDFGRKRANGHAETCRAMPAN